MPFSSDGDSIDFIYGVINWKELVDAETQAQLDDEVDSAVRTAPKLVAAAPAWADGPSAALEVGSEDVEALVALEEGDFDEEGSEDGDDDLSRILGKAPAARHRDEPSVIAGHGHNSGDVDVDVDVDGAEADEANEEIVAAVSGPATSLSDQLALAQRTAAAVRVADGRTRTTLYRALGRAHDFAAAADAEPAAYEVLLELAGITLQLRAPMTPIVKLIFGIDYDKTRLTEYAAVLSHARRIGVGRGGLGAFLEGFEGGIKGVVKAERAAKAPATPATGPDPRTAIADKPVLAELALDTGLAAGDYVVLLARVADGGTLDVVAAIGGDTALTTKAMRRAVTP
jgi:hypothetical protein